MPQAAFINRPKVRSAVYQLIILAALIGLAVAFTLDAKANLDALGVATGFGFLRHTAGFNVNLALIPYQETDTYGRVFVVGLLNTLLVAGLGVLFATILGFLVGIARLSPNWLLARLAAGYVELIRNLPLLFQILFWYLGVLGTLPGPRQSLSLFGEVFLNNRGVIVPAPVAGENASVVVAAFLLAVVAAIGLGIWARRQRERTGRHFPAFTIGAVLIVGLPLIAFAAAGFPIGIEHPRLQGFNFVGGVRLIPEFLALLVALVTYTAAFIAEIVRAGILAVPRGQYLNLTKNSSLAVAIGYPDLVAVFAGTTLNQTNQAVEIIAITMAVYLLISLATSITMNLYNARIRLSER
jgi:general L-amino acid transport system permease protein